MSRLIDADALIEFIENRYDITWKDDYEGGIKDACTDILEKISKMPTIEPEWKRGKWILTEDDEYEYCTCSECGYQNGENWMNGRDIPFCANCGANMRGEQDDEQRSDRAE